MPTMVNGLGGPAGYGENSFLANGVDVGNLDDGAVNVDLTSVFGPGGLELFGDAHTSMWINTNGLITFDSPNTAYTPIGVTGLTQPALAVLWTDYDIRGGDPNGSNNIYWDIDPAAGTVTVTWLGVDAYSNSVSGSNSFQMVLTARKDAQGNPTGGFELEYIYEDIQFSNGYTGDATIGVTDGDTNVIEPAISGNGSQITNIENTDFNQDGNGLFHLGIKDGGAPVCFLPGTLIDTIHGPIAIEYLRAGMMVRCRDRGYRPVRWVGASTHAGGQQEYVVIRSGALGNSQDIKVSPAHRILLHGPMVDLLTGEREVLASAAQLVNHTSIQMVRTKAPVRYHHVLLPGHELLCTSGLWSETLFPSQASRAGLSPQARLSFDNQVPARLVRDILSKGICRAQVQRHVAQLLGCELVASIRSDRQGQPARLAA